MNRKFSILILLLFFSLNSYSQIRIDKAINDLGDVFENNGLVHTKFKLKNPYYSDTIKIIDIMSSCGCTAVITKDSIIYPNTTLIMEITYDPKNRVGLFAKTIHLKTITGSHEKNSLYLKVIGNVINESKTKPNKEVALIEYKVAPIYFYPITAFDTSFFDLNKITDFSNDVTFEIDYTNFTNLGVEIRLRDRTQIENFELMISYFRKKMVYEMIDRGYVMGNVTFEEPIFIYDESIPSWSIGEVKVFSVNHNDDKLNESLIKLTKEYSDEQKDYLLNYYSNDYPNMDTLLNKIDHQTLNNILFTERKLNLVSSLLIPESYGVKEAKKITKKFKKKLYKSLKNTSGISKKDLELTFDTIGIYPATKFKLLMWRKEINNGEKVIKYVEKPEEIIVPLLPTYKEDIISTNTKLTVNTVKFQQFWEAILAYTNTGKNIELIIESSVSNFPKLGIDDPLSIAKDKGENISAYLKEKYFKETGKLLDVKLILTRQGPGFDTKNFTNPDYLQYEYIKLIPNYRQDRGIQLDLSDSRPYSVNYDYYYIGVDISSVIFKKFCKFIINEIQQFGFVELRTESSTSHIIVDSRKSNEYWAYSHLNISKKRLDQYLRSKLIDPNRVIYTNEKIVVQGMPFDRSIPVVRYKKYQYVTFVPVKHV